MLMAILAIVLTLLCVLGIHEAGHAVAARIFNVTIKKISIGFGRPLLQWQSKKGVQWIWAMWPLGGYVELLNTRISPVTPDHYEHCFDKKPIWIRFIILSAGIFANLLTAWLAFVMVFYLGLTYRVPQVLTVQPNSVAAQAGLLAGDKIIAVNESATPAWNDIGMQLLISWGQKDVKITVKQMSDGQIRTLNLDLSQVKLVQQKKSMLTLIGISPDGSAANTILRAPSLLKACQQANESMGTLAYFFIILVKQLVTGVIPFLVLLGPLGLFVTSILSLMQGLIVFMYFIASLSLVVALMNALPIPGLDGGGMLYLLMEKIRGKPVSVAMEVLLHRLVVILFCVLLFNLVMNDLIRYF